MRERAGGQVQVQECRNQERLEERSLPSFERRSGSAARAEIGRNFRPSGEANQVHQEQGLQEPELELEPDDLHFR